MQIELEKVSIDFECPDCEEFVARVSVTEIIETGGPICVNCNEEMEAICAHIEQMEGIEG